MRPDRLVVGEVRGAEVVELLAALNTGHDGGSGTVHANTSAALPARIEALALAAGLPRDAAHSQLSAGVDAVVHLARDRSGRRRVAELGCLERGPDGLVRVDVALRVDPTGRTGPGLSRGAARAPGGRCRRPRPGRRAVTAATGASAVLPAAAAGWLLAAPGADRRRRGTGWRRGPAGGGRGRRPVVTASPPVRSRPWSWAPSSCCSSGPWEGQLP